MNCGGIGPDPVLSAAANNNIPNNRSNSSDGQGKSYHFGYTLMDTGVGSFIFMAGLVAPEARMNSIAHNKLKVGVAR